MPVFWSYPEFGDIEVVEAEESEENLLECEIDEKTVQNINNYDINFPDPKYYCIGFFTS